MKIIRPEPEKREVRPCVGCGTPTLGRVHGWCTWDCYDHHEVPLSPEPEPSV